VRAVDQHFRFHVDRALVSAEAAARVDLVGRVEAIAAVAGGERVHPDRSAEGDDAGARVGSPVSADRGGAGTGLRGEPDRAYFRGDDGEAIGAGPGLPVVVVVVRSGGRVGR